MITVFDSSAWISALNFGGIPRAALNAASERGKIAISEAILEEVHRILRAKFAWEMTQINESLREYSSGLRQVTASGLIHGICRDPDDDMVLDCAVTAGASVIVSGDKDLLALEEYEGIRILTPRGFLDEFPAPPLP